MTSAIFGGGGAGFLINFSVSGGMQRDSITAKGLNIIVYIKVILRQLMCLKTSFNMT